MDEPVPLVKDEATQVSLDSLQGLGSEEGNSKKLLRNGSAGSSRATGMDSHSRRTGMDLLKAKVESTKENLKLDLLSHIPQRPAPPPRMPRSRSRPRREPSDLCSETGSSSNPIPTGLDLLQERVNQTKEHLREELLSFVPQRPPPVPRRERSRTRPLREPSDLSSETSVTTGLDLLHERVAQTKEHLREELLSLIPQRPPAPPQREAKPRILKSDSVTGLDLLQDKIKETKENVREKLNSLVPSPPVLTAEQMKKARSRHKLYPCSRTTSVCTSRAWTPEPGEDQDEASLHHRYPYPESVYSNASTRTGISLLKGRIASARDNFQGSLHRLVPERPVLTAEQMRRLKHSQSTTALGGTLRRSATAGSGSIYSEQTTGMDVLRGKLENAKKSLTSLVPERLSPKPVEVKKRKSVKKVSKSKSSVAIATATGTGEEESEEVASPNLNLNDGTDTLSVISGGQKRRKENITQEIRNPFEVIENMVEAAREKVVGLKRNPSKKSLKGVEGKRKLPEEEPSPPPPTLVNGDEEEGPPEPLEAGIKVRVGSVEVEQRKVRRKGRQRKLDEIVVKEVEKPPETIKFAAPRGSISSECSGDPGDEEVVVGRLTLEALGSNPSKVTVESSTPFSASAFASSASSTFNHILRLTSRALLSLAERVEEATEKLEGSQQRPTQNDLDLDLEPARSRSHTVIKAKIALCLLLGLLAGLYLAGIGKGPQDKNLNTWQVNDKYKK